MATTRRGQKQAAEAPVKAESKTRAAPKVKTVAKAKTVKAEKEVAYKERQVAHLCPMHSLNHVLQEEKIVWASSKPFLLTAGLKAAPEGATPKDANIKLNLWAYCKERGLAHLRAQRAEYLHEDATRLFRQVSAGEPSLEDEYYKNPKYTQDFPRDLVFWQENNKKYGNKSVEEIVKILDAEYGKDESLKQLEDGGIGCTMSGVSRGDLPFAWFRDLFDMMGYEHVEVDDVTYKKVLNEHLTDPTYFGMVVNQGAWHYVSVPRFVPRADCPAKKYVLADSLDKNVYNCHTKRELFRALDVLPLVRAFLLFAKDGDAYQSVAVKRMIKAAGRKKRTRKN